MKDLVFLFATTGIFAVVLVLGFGIVLKLIEKRIIFKLEIIDVQNLLIEIDDRNLYLAWFEMLKLFKREITIYETLNKKGITVIDDPNSTKSVIVIDTKKFDPNKIKTWRYLYQYQIEKDIKYAEGDKVMDLIEIFGDTITIVFDINVENYIIDTEDE